MWNSAGKTAEVQCPYKLPHTAKQSRADWAHRGLVTAQDHAAYRKTAKKRKKNMLQNAL